MVSTDEGVVTVAVFLLGLCTAYAAYKAALPRPLPGIPYNHDAARSLLGDAPEMVGYIWRTKRVFVSHHPPEDHFSAHPNTSRLTRW